MMIQNITRRRRSHNSSLSVVDPIWFLTLAGVFISADSQRRLAHYLVCEEKVPRMNPARSRIPEHSLHTRRTRDPEAAQASRGRARDGQIDLQFGLKRNGLRQAEATVLLQAQSNPCCRK